jgi:hypothetical protein
VGAADDLLRGAGEVPGVADEDATEGTDDAAAGVDTPVAA